MKNRSDGYYMLDKCQDTFEVGADDYGFANVWLPCKLCLKNCDLTVTDSPLRRLISSVLAYNPLCWKTDQMRDIIKAD